MTVEKVWDELWVGVVAILPFFEFPVWLSGVLVVVWRV